MATRTYTFTTGIETSDAPSASSPTATGDILTLGYADTNYARRRDLGWTAASYAALKAIGTTGDNQRYDGQTRLVIDTNELWAFDADSSATDDGATILQPNSGTGRWLIVSGSSSSSSSSSGFETLTQKLELDYLTALQTEHLDNSVGVAFVGEDYWAGVTGSMLDTAASGATSIRLVWNARTVNDSSLNIDATTNWSAVNAGASLTASNTAGDFKVGTHGLKFDKDNSATTAGLRYDRGSQDLSLSAHWRMFFWVKLPSLTNLSNVFVRVYADSTTNYAQWTLTSNYAGSALIADWNLMFVDLSTTPTSTGGTGWTKASLARYVEISVTTSSAGQTYTGIIYDSLYFSLGDVTQLGVIGQEHTLFNTSTKQSIVIDSSNVSGDGHLTLAAATPVTADYNGGLTSSNGFIQRSVLKSSSGKSATFDAGFTSGPIATAQEYRSHAVLRESQSGNFTGFVDYWQPEVFTVKVISGSTVSGQDFGNVSANCLSGDSYNWFRPYYGREQVRYIYMGDKVQTSNSSYDSTNGYINLPLASASGVSGGDILSKKSITSSISVVGLNSNESFSSFTASTSPNGIQFLNQANAIPFKSNLSAWYAVGGYTDADAVRNRVDGSAIAGLDIGGNSNLRNPLNENLHYARFSVSGQYLENTSGTTLNGNGERVQFLFWVRLLSGLGGSGETVVGGSDATFNHGWYITRSGSQALQLFRLNSGVDTSTAVANLPLNTWFMVAGAVESGANGYFYTNGRYTTFSSGTISSSANKIIIGSSGTSPGMDFTNLLLWRNSTDLTLQQLIALENNGKIRPFEFGGTLRNKYDVTGQSGQKLSMKVNASKNTTLITTPYVKKFGVIKT